MKHFYCSLWDQKYCAQGLALFESLMKHSSAEVTIYVLPLDIETDVLLRAMALKGMVVISPALFEEALGMAAIKANRTFAEYCYTCASCLCEYVMLHHGVPEISYIDSDCWFMSDPEVIFGEIGKRSIGIIPHRFAEKDRPRLAINGEYNVSLVHFKDTPAGRDCLQRWARACRNWCYLRNENGKYADQGYLNNWPEAYAGECCVIENIGVGCAPWNMQQYRVELAKDGVYVDGCRLAMYHMHEFRDNGDGTFRLTNYPLRHEDSQFIYAPYIAAVTAAKERIGALQPA